MYRFDKRKRILISLSFFLSFLLGMALPTIEINIRNQTLEEGLIKTAWVSPIVITNNAGFAAHSSSGDGSAENPWIIENKDINLYGTLNTGITIQHTTEYFIVQNCQIFYPYPWNGNSLGMKFYDVQNGDIRNNKIYPHPNLYLGIYPCIYAIYVLECQNLNISGNFIPPPFLNAIGLDHCDSINVIGNHLNGYNDIWANRTDNSKIMYNTITGRYDAPETFVNLNTGIYLRESYGNIIESNTIENYNTLGIQLDYYSENNIIVENTFYTPINDGHLFPFKETNWAGPNHYFDMRFPEDSTTFIGPDAASPGWYPATIGWDEYSTGANCTWRGPESLQGDLGYEGVIIANKTDVDDNDHKKVAKLFTGNEGAPQVSLTLDTAIEEDVSSGTCEFWFLIDDPSNSGYLDFEFISDYGILFDIVVDHLSLKYRTDSILTDTGISVENDKWYRISVDFSDDFTGVVDPHTYRFRLMNASGRKVLYSSPLALYEDNGDLKDFKISLEGGATNMTVYLDAIGYSWDYELYEPGDNQNAGIKVIYKSQEFPIGYSYVWGSRELILDGVSQEYYLKKGDDQKFLIIPVPSVDGQHTLTLRAWTSAWQIEESPVYSDPIHFSSYYASILDIGRHDENGLLVAEDTEIVAPGLVSLSDSTSLTINLTNVATSYITTSNLTWTNVSITFKKNDEPWQGPFNMDYDYGLMNASFSINEGNYTSFDYIYYYLIFDQYDNTSNYLDSFYWTSDGIIKYDESLARELAFNKKVAPVLYQLSLTYSVWYKAQIERNFITEDSESTVSLYPWMRIANQNFTMDYYNQTSSLTSYDVTTDANNMVINHTHYSDMGNITAVSPPFTLSQGIKSPFAIPTDLSLTPFTSSILVPQMMFDSLQPGRNLTYTSTLLDLLYVGNESWPTENRRVMKFSSGADDVVIRYDVYTGIMVYFHYIDNTENVGRKIVFALINNNNSYPIDLTIDIRPEIMDENTTIIPNYLFAIVYDPPGDQSFSQITSGTSLTLGLGLEKAETEAYHLNTEVYAFGIGGGVDMSMATTESTGFDAEVTVTFERTITSSLESEDPDYIGPGRGDVYVLSGLIVHYRFVVNNAYIVRGTPDMPNNSTDDIKVWENGSRVEYSPGINSSVTVTGAVLEEYGLESLENENPFVNNQIEDQELSLVELDPSSPVFFTPNYYTEMVSSFTTSATYTRSMTMEMSLDTFMAWDIEISSGLFVEQTTFASSGNIGMIMEMSTTTTSTTSIESNKEIMCHLEDDDGTPIGEHDQFLVSVYKDLRWDTFGFIMDEDLTYTSNPHEYGTRDRRSPPAAEFFAIDEYIGGSTLLSCSAVDEETGVNHVRFYIDDDPTFDTVMIDVDGVFIDDFDSIPGYLGYVDTPTLADPDVYEYLFDTSTYHGTYYLFIVLYDNGFPLRNYKVSDPFLIHIDNVNPSKCIIRAYEPYCGAIDLFIIAADVDSGVEYVEYWDGDPAISGSILLGVGSDASQSFNFVWTTDANMTDDGDHEIYARCFDRAGNFLTSSAIHVNVDNSPILPKKSMTSTEISLLVTSVAAIAMAVLAFILGIKKNRISLP